MYRISLFLLLFLFVGCGNHDEGSTSQAEIQNPKNTNNDQFTLEHEPTAEELMNIIKKNDHKLETINGTNFDDTLWKKVSKTISVPHLWDSMQTVIYIGATIDWEQYFLWRKGTIVNLGNVTSILFFNNQLFFANEFEIGDENSAIGMFEVIDNNLVTTQSEEMTGIHNVSLKLKDNKIQVQRSEMFGFTDGDLIGDGIRTIDIGWVEIRDGKLIIVDDEGNELDFDEPK